MKEIKEQLRELQAELSAASLERGKDWNGYSVFIPRYNDEAFVGLPLVVLVNGDEARLSTPEEGMEYLEFENTDKK